MSKTKTGESQMARKFEKVCEIIENNESSKARLIPILQQIQEEYRYLPEDILTFVATALDMSPGEVFGVATFYSHFTLHPKGKYVIKMCDGTACHVKNSIPILDALRKELGLKGEKVTTDDLLFTVETVSCLGACGLAPVLMINEDVYGAMTPEKSLNVLKGIMEKESN